MAESGRRYDQGLILYAISNFRLLESRLTAPMQFFLNWFAFRNPQFLLNKESPGDPMLIDKIRLNFPDLDSEVAFSAAYKALELYAPSLFPSFSIIKSTNARILLANPKALYFNVLTFFLA